MKLYQIETKQSSRTFYVVAPSAEDAMHIWRDNWPSGSTYKSDYITKLECLYEDLILPKEAA